MGVGDCKINIMKIQKDKDNLHIGNLVKKELLRQERTVSWLARKLCCDRSNVYKIFLRPTIDSELLFRISVILHHDFFKDYSQLVCRQIGNTSV